MTTTAYYMTTTAPPLGVIKNSAVQSYCTVSNLFNSMNIEQLEKGYVTMWGVILPTGLCVVWYSAESESALCEISLLADTLLQCPSEISPVKADAKIATKIVCSKWLQAQIAVFASDFKFCRTTPAFAFAFAFSVKFQKLIFHLLVVSSYFLFTKKMYKWGMHAELRPGITTVYYIVHMYILYSVSLYIRHHGTYTRKTEISR